MQNIDLSAVTKVARALEKLDVEYALVGGTILGFLLDNPALTQLRVTDDVDAIVNVVTLLQYAALEKKLRKIGFQHDISEGAPICRWIFEGSKVDVMPVKDHTGGMSDEWFGHAINSASLQSFGGATVRVISATSFIALKLAAFRERGQNDYFGSHDLEDILTVVDGRELLLAELRDEEPTLRMFVSNWFRMLLDRPAFIDALPGHLEPDSASQQRLPQLLQRLQDLARLQ